MRDYIHTHKSQIESTLYDFFGKKKAEISHINRWAFPVVDHLESAVMGGKMIRGVLVVLGYELGGKKASEDIYKIAAAYELFHTGFLIHDDIIDGDSLRRGKPTMHKILKEMTTLKGIQTSDHYGEGLAIGAGDIAFFSAYEMLFSTRTLHHHLSSIALLISKEMAIVGLGEIDDIVLGLEESVVQKDSIMNCYRYKTARYTFSIPLSIGGQLGGLTSAVIDDLEDVGEQLGIVFQLKDDELGMMGNAEETGKAVGNDIREGKKTLYYYYLFMRSSKEEQTKLKSIFGYKEAPPESITFVQELVRQYGIDKEIERITSEYLLKAKNKIEDLHLPSHHLLLFTGLVELLSNRSR